MSGLVSRRGLLTRQAESRMPSGPRPPWSVASFDTDCDACGVCLPICPEAILVPDAAGRPVIDFVRGGCTFCGACDQACLPRDGSAAAIDRAAAGLEEDRLPLVARLGGSCISLQGVVCRLCGDPCDARAIRFRPLTGGRSLPEISSETCTGCGICVSACPAGALSMTSPES